MLAMSIRISEASKKEDHVHMLFLIAYMIRYQSREERASVLEVDGFDERLKMLDDILKREYDRIKDLVKRAETYNTAEGKKDGLRAPALAKRRLGRLNGGGGGKGGEGSEVEQLAKKFDGLELPEEAKEIV